MGRWLCSVAAIMIFVRGERQARIGAERIEIMHDVVMIDGFAFLRTQKGD